MPTSLLFFAAVAIWGTTWIAITFQTPALAAEPAVALRFSLAAALVLAWCRLRGIALPRRRRDHAYLALLGVLGFSLAYFCVYWAEAYIVTGLIAVGYSTLPLTNMVLARLFFGTPMSRRVAAGGALGLTGVALIFWPEFAAFAADRPVAAGAALTAAAVLTSAVSNMIVMRNQQAGLTGWPPLGLAMGYGAIASWLAVLLLDRPLTIAWSWPFALSLAYLVVAGSALAFAAYYVVLERIGPARAAYVGVMATVVALVISTIFEGYDWRLATGIGVALTLAGNVLALHRPTAAR